MMISLFLQVAGEPVECRLLKIKDADYVRWEKVQDDLFGEYFNLTIKTDTKVMTIKEMVVDPKIDTSQADIEGFFWSALLEERVAHNISEANGFEHTLDSDDVASLKEHKPYDPKRIRVDTRPFSVEYTCSLIKRGKLDLSPEFQREFVWTENKRKSRLIESIMLRIPIPAFYLSQDDEGKFQVVDGIQRLTVINDFVNNKFKLKNLEYLRVLEDKWFRAEGKPEEKSLPEVYAERIEQTQLHFNIIDPSTPEQVKYDIFRRINTGGKALNSQEVRNCLSKPKTRNLLREMVTLESFLAATRGSIRSTRMADREVATRFVGFYLLYEKRLSFEYKGDMDEFLNSTTDYLNINLNDALNNEITSAFDKAMINAYTLFESSAFRKAAFINKALFVSWSCILYNVDNEMLKSIAEVTARAKGVLNERIRTDISYSESISRGTNDVERMKVARRVAKEILEALMNDK